MDLIKYHLDLIVNDQKLHKLNKDELKVVLMNFAKEYHKQQLLIHSVVKSLPQDNYCKVCKLPTDGEKCYSKRCPI
jgi:hypothetical protein